MVTWQNSPSTSTPLDATTLATAFAEKTTPADAAAAAAVLIATEHTTERAYQSSTYALIAGLATADDTVRLQGLITAGHVVGMVGQNYQISAPLVIGSNRVLDLRGCTVTLKPGSNCNLIRNAAVTPTATATDGAITTGTSIVTTSLAAQAVVGQTCMVAGAGASTFGGTIASVLTGIIASKTGTTVTLAKLDGAPLLAGATVSGAAVSLITRDSNITIRGGTWARGANGGTGTSQDVHSILLRHVDVVSVDIEGGTSTGGKYMVAFGDVSQVWCRARGLNTASDGVHVEGPAFGVHIDEVTGTTGDDLCAFTSNDYTNDSDVSGDVQGITIGNLTSVNGVARALLLSAGPLGYVGGVKVLGVVTGSAAMGLVALGDTVSGNGGTYGSIDVGLIDGRSSATMPDLNIWSGTFQTIRASVKHSSTFANAVKLGGLSTNTVIGVLDLYNCNIGGVGTSVSAVEVGSNVTVSELIVDKMRYNCASPYSMVHLNSATATVTEISIRDPLFISASYGGTGVVQDAGTVSRVKYVGGTLTACGAAFAGLASASAVVVTITGTLLSGTSRAVTARSTTTVILNGPTFAGLLNAALYASGGTLVVIGHVYVTTGAGLFGRLATESIRANGAQLATDLTLLTPSDGDMIYNTNAGAACGVGPVVYNTAAAKWKHLYTGVTN